MKKLIYLFLLIILCNTSYADTEISTAGTNLGIGTTAVTNALSIASTLAIGDATYTVVTAPAGGAIIQGNVGIGSLHPGTALDVTGTIRASTDVKAAGLSLCRSDGTNCPAAAGTNYWSSSAGTGNVGINTTSRSVGIGTFMGSAALVVMPPQDGHINVGIGTWNPIASLEVIGTQRVSGVITASGGVTGNLTGNASGNAGTVTFADAGGDTTTFPSLGTSATGSLAPATDAELTYNSTTNALTTTTFIGALTGNSDTTTALAANPTNCSAGNYPLGIDASGNVENCTAAGAGGSGQWITQSGVGIGTVDAVGIGTYRPNLKLDVRGNIGIGTFGINNVANINIIGDGTTNWLTGYKDLDRSNDNAVSINANGNIGIGTVDAIAKLTLSIGSINVAAGNVTTYGNFTSSQGNFLTNKTAGNITVGYGAGSGMYLGGDGNLDAQILTTSFNSYDMIFKTNDIQRMVLNVANLGIGTATPGQVLDVNGFIRSTSLTASKCVHTDGTGTLTSAAADCGSGGSSQWFTGTNTLGNVGIGTYDAVGIGTTMGNGAFVVMNTPTGGNVGIGTWNPIQKLEVKGTVQATTFSGAGTGLTGTAASLTAGNVTTNANLTGEVTSTGNAALLGSFSSSALKTALTDETGSGGVAVFSTSPTLTTPVLGVATGTSLTTTGNIGIGTTTISDGGLIVMNQNVGIGSLHPGTTLDNQGTIRTTGLQLNLNPNASYVLQSNAVGVGTWVPSTTLAVTATASPAGNNRAIQYNNAGTTAGSDNFTFGANSNIGIGTIDAVQKLTVVGNIGIGTVKDGDLYISTAPPLGGMIIEKNVGIGTVTPGTILDTVGTHRTTGLQLNLAPLAGGNVLVSNTVGVGTWMPSTTLNVTATATPGGSSPQLQYNSAGAMGGIGSGGTDGTNIGIGTVSFTNVLNIQGNVGIGTTGYGPYVSQSATSAGISLQGNLGIGTWKPLNAVSILNGSVGIGTTAYDAYVSQVAVVKQMVIQSNVGIGTWESRNSLIVMSSGAPSGGGNIGIGTLAPGVSLDVNGTYRGSGSGDSYYAGNIGLGTTIPMGTLAVQGSIVQGTVTQTGQAVDTNVVALSGNVGIGTWVANQNLILKGNVGIGTTLANTLVGSFSPASPGGQLYVQGNVGIGTNTPGANLDVNGTVRSTRTTDIGWSVVTGANTACNTTCTSACVFGEDTAVVGTIVGCADASADVCVCAGGS